MVTDGSQERWLFFIGAGVGVRQGGMTEEMARFWRGGSLL